MAFRLKPSKRIRTQLARIVASEARKASREMTARSPGEESVHEARKHVKKVRAVLRLLRKPLGNDYARLNECARSAAHEMSGVRDADALVGVLESLRNRYQHQITPAVFRTASNMLKARRRDAYSGLAGRPLGDIRKTLEQSRHDLRSSVKSVATGRTMREGIKRGYRRARQAMRDATATATADDVQFHLWRRRVKDHWYQLRLVEGLNRQAHGRVRRLTQLQDWLGEHHNLAVLRAAILEQPRRFGDARTVKIILGCIDSRQAGLRRRSVRRGRRLFSRKPSSFQKQVAKWWRKRTA